MKKTLLLAGIAVMTLSLWPGFAASCDAARAKGKVMGIIDGTGAGICRIIKTALPQRADDPCDVNGTVPEVVRIEGKIPAGLEPGQAIILKVKSAGKIVAKVVALAGNDAPLNDIADQFVADGANILWRNADGESYLILKTKKNFKPSEGEVVKLKTRSARKKVEGC